jgi:hypothetical protein
MVFLRLLGRRNTVCWDPSCRGFSFSLLRLGGPLSPWALPGTEYQCWPRLASTPRPPQHPLLGSDAQLNTLVVFTFQNSGALHSNHKFQLPKHKKLAINSTDCGSTSGMPIMVASATLIISLLDSNCRRAELPSHLHDHRTNLHYALKAMSCCSKGDYRINEQKNLTFTGTSFLYRFIVPEIHSPCTTLPIYTKLGFVRVVHHPMPRESDVLLNIIDT